MKLSYFLKLFSVIIFIMTLTLTTSCNAKLSEQEIAYLEKFMTVFTNPNILGTYNEESNKSLIDMVSMRLVVFDDERISHNPNVDFNITDFHNTSKDRFEYIIPESLVYEEIYKYFGIEKDAILQDTSQRPTMAVLYDNDYYINWYRYDLEVYAKIEKVIKQGDELILSGYTVDSNGQRYIRPTHVVSSEILYGCPWDGIYEFEAVVSPHEYNGEKTWKLVEFTPIY